MNPKIRNAIIATVAVLVVGGIVVKFKWPKIQAYLVKKRYTHLREKVWPKERELTAQKVKTRQLQDDTHDAVTIPLKSFINAKLREAPICWKGNPENNLAELPAGINTYAGVPFDVEGSIQLMGGWLKHYKKTYPVEVDSIPIQRECKKIHLLHGESYLGVKEMGNKVAKLVIHYQDDTTKEFELVAGKQCFDWWFPTFQTGVAEKFRTPAPGTELAWIGTNPYLRQWQPDLSLCLYRTSFDNPQPDVKIASVDYVSNNTQTCPFLLALTVE